MTETATASGEVTSEEQVDAWSGACAAHGVYLHPVHNWFVGTAHDEATIDEVLERTDAAFDVVRDRFGAG